MLREPGTAPHCRHTVVPSHGGGQANGRDSLLCLQAVGASVSTRSSRAGDEQNAMGKQAMEGQNLSEEQGRLARGRDMLAAS